MRIRIWLAAALAGLLVVGSDGPARAQKGVPASTVIVGGHGMLSDHELIENMTQSADNHVFMDLLKTSGLIDVLRQKGPFTVFAPTDEAFADLSPGLLDALRKPENKPRLVALLSAHILPDIFSSARLRLLLRGSKGQVDLETYSGGKLTIGTNGPSNLVIRNANGIAADITLYDVKQANGVVFIIDRVVVPG